LILLKLALTGNSLVEAVRRYSKQPHLWSLSKRLAKLLTRPIEQRAELSPSRPHVHKLAQRVTAEEARALQDAYRDGASLAELQLQLGLSRGSVQRVLREAGVRRRHKSLTDEKVEVLVRRYEAGMTIREIAAEQGLAKTTVQDALERADVTKRPAVRRLQ
jgi:DNA-directed RNA polymerase specialized sigma24 family protein